MLRIHYFARLRDQLGCATDELVWQKQFHTIGDVKQALCERGPLWQQALNGNILVAHNHQISPETTTLQDGDEIAFFPPVTGG